MRLLHTLLVVSYHFFNFLSHSIFVLNHGDHVLVDSRSKDHVQRLSLGGHVANHLVMGENVVPVQHTVMVHTLSAERHLEQHKGNKEG